MTLADIVNPATEAVDGDRESLAGLEVEHSGHPIGAARWEAGGGYDDFMQLLEPAVHGVQVGEPTAEATEVGPLISAAQRDPAASCLEGRPVALIKIVFLATDPS